MLNERSQTLESANAINKRYAWRIPWTEEPGRLQSMGSRRVGHWVTSLSLSCIGEGNGNLLQCSCLENPRDGGACWAAVYGVAQSRTRLKRLSSSSKTVLHLIEMCGTSLFLQFWNSKNLKKLKDLHNLFGDKTSLDLNYLEVEVNINYKSLFLVFIHSSQSEYYYI